MVSAVFHPGVLAAGIDGGSNGVAKSAPLAGSTPEPVVADLKATLTARAEAGGFPLAAMVKDDERCIRCGLCAIRCPTDAMTMERFSITERFR